MRMMNKFSFGYSVRPASETSFNFGPRNFVPVYGELFLVQMSNFVESWV